AERDVNAYHKFMWRYHLDYAETYEIAQRFGYDNFNVTRKLFFRELPRRLRAVGLDARRDIHSVLEVGCSSGYLLRFMETDMFPAATCLQGIDIDAYAIDTGNHYLARIDSRIELLHADMDQLDELLGEKKFDFVLAAGILLYLDEPAATRLVELMMKHTRKMLAITALAHPEEDNATLEQSVPRQRDCTWIHNVDAMIRQAGGNLVARRWEGGKLIDGNTIYFLYATPLDPHSESKLIGTLPGHRYH
ncbi:MAG TPA: class I SAM-dependent methyltransferase, partial [Gammaproteobacteria bacterium]|nr:class I SAM-dependent methyltransferase [Gammaproteobacteria bacterium]